MPIGPDDVGRRVVLRHLLPDRRATDVLGELVDWDATAGFARVASRSGLVEVPLADILMGHPVPPPPEPRSRRRPVPLMVLELHDVMADGWQALEREDHGGWRLRAAEGFTGRSNSVLPLGPPPGELGQAVDQVERWYAERGLPGRFCLPWALGSGPDDPGYGADPLEAELVRRRYLLDTPTIVMTCSLRSTTAVAAPPGLTLDLRAEPDEAWLALYHYRGQELPPVAVRVLTSAPAQIFASLRTPGGAAVAVGRGASARGWTGISAVEVSPEHRRQGLAQVVMAALLDWGRERGDHSAYLQVARANAPARALYGRLGFTEHSGYHYRVQPA